MSRSVSFRRSEWEAVDAAAKAAGKTRSEFVWACVADRLDSAHRPYPALKHPATRSRALDRTEVEPRFKRR